jgi:hypothetical protein
VVQEESAKLCAYMELEILGKKVVSTLFQYGKVEKCEV